MLPPPPLVSALTSAMCIGITVWTYLSDGSITAALAVASFAVLSLQLLAVEKPAFSQMTSSVFGLFYCGAHMQCCSSALRACCAELAAGEPRFVQSLVHTLPLPVPCGLRVGEVLWTVLVAAEAAPGQGRLMKTVCAWLTDLAMQARDLLRLGYSCNATPEADTPAAWVRHRVSAELLGEAAGAGSARPEQHRRPQLAGACASAHEE